MIQLHPDCLIFRTSSGESIPCTAESVTIELIGESVEELDPNVVREAAAAVVFYFKHDLGREQVSVEEFSRALQKVLDKLGYEVVPSTEDEPVKEGKATILNLPALASASGKGFELFFFQRLRSELQEGLRRSPQELRFQGLRSCVKQLMMQNP